MLSSRKSINQFRAIVGVLCGVGVGDQPKDEGRVGERLIAETKGSSLRR